MRRKRGHYSKIEDMPKHINREFFNLGWSTAQRVLNGDCEVKGLNIFRDFACGFAHAILNNFNNKKGVTAEYMGITIPMLRKYLQGKQEVKKINTQLIGRDK